MLAIVKTMANFSLQNYGVFTDLLVKHNAEIEGDLVVDGDLTLGPTSTLVVPGSVDIGANLFVGGSEAIVGDLTIGGSASITGNLTVGGINSLAPIEAPTLCLNDQITSPTPSPNQGCLFTSAGQPDTLNFIDNQGTVNQVAFNPILSTYNVTFQLFDFGPFAVDGTQFTVKVKAKKTPFDVTLYFPAIGFQVGQGSTEDSSYPFTGLPPTGFVRTVAGQLPVDLCPNQLTYQTTIAASHQGVMNAWSNSNVLFVGNMELSSFEGYITPTTFNGYINPAGYYLFVDTSSIVGPGLFIGSSIYGQGGASGILVPQGTTIVGINPLGPGTYLLNTVAGPIGAPPGTFVPFTTQSILVIDSITSGSPPANGAIITGPGVTNSTTVYEPIPNEVNPDGTGSYFVNTLTTTVSSAVPFPYTIIPVVSTAGFPSSGTLLVGPDVVNYTGIFGNTFTGCSGGQASLAQSEPVQYSLIAGSSGSPISLSAAQDTILNVTQFTAGNPLRPGMTLYGNGVAPGTTIIAFSSGTGGVGTYIVSPPQIFASTNLTVTQTIGSIVSFPVPPSGYQVMVGPMGDILIGGVGQNFNYLRAGNHNLKPFSMTYLVQAPLVLPQNIAVSKPFTNITQFSGGFYGAWGSALRDVHVTAAYGGKVIFAWSDNSGQADQTNNVTDCVIAIGNIVSGQLVMQPPVTLTNNISNPPGFTYVFDTAVVINPTNPNNIVVSWGTGNVPTQPNRAVSMDGGLTWTIVGLTNLNPVGSGLAGDNRGVSVDKYGNIWYGTTNFAPPYYAVDQPTWWVSPDGGVTFYVAYTVPPLPWPEDGYDTPQMTFGYDGSGNYGFYYDADYFASYGQSNSLFTDITPIVGFVPITGKMSASTTANFTGSVAGTVLTITSMTSGTIMVGQTLCGDNKIPGVYLDPTTKIVSFGTGSGGVGTYNVNISQTVPSSNIYASFPPIGPLPLSGNSTTVTVATALPNNTINVVSTAGFPTVGTLLFPNGATVIYNSMTPTAFTGCSNGYGTANVGDVIVQPSTPSYLFNFTNQQFSPSLAAAADGRVWYSCQAPYYNVGMGPSIRYKSPATGSPYPDIVAANYAGNWIVGEPGSYYPPLLPGFFSGEISYPSFGYFNDDRVIAWDEPRQALYMVTQFGPLPDSQDMRIAFVISRDNGQTWSDLIYVANTFSANRGQVNMILDPVTGDLIFSWYDGRNDTATYQNIQYFAGIMPAAQLSALVNDIPLSNPTYQSPNANVPGSYVITQVSSNTPALKGPSNGSILKSGSNTNVKGRMSRRHMRKSQQRP